MSRNHDNSLGEQDSNCSAVDNDWNYQPTNFIWPPSPYSTWIFCKSEIIIIIIIISREIPFGYIHRVETLKDCCVWSVLACDDHHTIDISHQNISFKKLPCFFFSFPTKMYDLNRYAPLLRTHKWNMEYIKTCSDWLTGFTEWPTSPISRINGHGMNETRNEITNG